MADRTKTNPTGAPLTNPLPTARRLWGRVLVGRPIPIPQTEFAVVYDLDRVMGLTQHMDAILAPIQAEERAIIAAHKARKVAFADQWADLVARKLGTTQTVAAQLDQVGKILAGDGTTGADKLANLRRYLVGLDNTAPTADEWAAYEAAQAEQEAQDTANLAVLDTHPRRRLLAIIADVVVQVGGLATPDAATLTWQAADGPRPDPRDPETWADWPDLVLSWLCNAGVDAAQLQVDSFRFGRPSSATLPQ